MGPLTPAGGTAPIPQPSSHCLLFPQTERNWKKSLDNVSILKSVAVRHFEFPKKNCNFYRQTVGKGVTMRHRTKLHSDLSKRCRDTAVWRFLANVNFRYMLSPVRLSVVCLSVTFVRPAQAVQIFGNISMALGTLAIRWHPMKISWRSSQGNPFARGVRHKRGSQI